MTAFDYAVLALIGFSLLMGMWRGVVSELLAIATWVLAFVAARYGAAPVAAWMKGLIADPTLRQAAAVAGVFVLVLVLGTLVRLVVSKLINSLGLGLLDRMLGALFGVVRGAVVAVALVLLGGVTALPRQPWWREAMLSPPLETAALLLKSRLPADMAARVHFR